MATKKSVQFNETAGFTDKEWLIVSDVAAGFTLVKIDASWSLGSLGSSGWTTGATSDEEVGMWALEVVNTGAGSFQMGGDFDDFRIVGLTSYGTQNVNFSMPDNTGNGVRSQIITGEFHWRGTRYYPAASDLYFAMSQENFTGFRVPKGWCSVTYWTG